MPVEAFKDLWDTLKAGRPWIGMVKNRCKNGDYYWVEAHAAPIYESGQVVGYMSVRRKPKPEQVRGADEIYAKFRAGEAKGKTVSVGRVVSTGAAGNLLAKMSIKARMWAMLGVVAAMLIVGAGIGLSAMYSDIQALDKTYERRLLPVLYLGQVTALIRENRAQVLLSLQHAPDSKYAKDHDHSIKMHIEAIDKNIGEITRLWGDYEKLVFSDKHKDLANAFIEARSKFVAEGLKPAREALGAEKFDEANALLLTKMNPNFVAVQERGDALMKYNTEKAQEEYGAQKAQYEFLRNIVLVAIVVALALATWLVMVLTRFITRPMAVAREAFVRIAQGDYTSQIDIARDDEAGKVLQGLESMQTRLGFDVAEAKRQADETLRIKIALDNVSTGVMIANTERTIIYANQSVKRILKGAESEIKKQLPNFDADNMVGVNIDTFHKNPAHQAKLLAEFTSTYTANLEIGSRHLRVTASPVINEQGARLGAVAEWLDRTAEVAVEREVESIIVGASEGDFTRRLSIEDKDGFFRNLAEGLNQLLETASSGLSAVAEVLGSLSRGDLTQTDDRRLPGHLWSVERRHEHDGGAFAGSGGADQGSDGSDQRGGEGDCGGEPGPVEPDGRAGEQSGRDGQLDGATQRDGQAERRKCAAGERTGRHLERDRHAWRADGQASRRHHERHPGQLEEDCRHRRRHRQHCLPDQHPGPQRGGRSRAGRRAGPGLCGRRQRSPQPGATQCHGRQGNQGTDRRIGGQGRKRRAAGQ